MSSLRAQSPPDPEPLDLDALLQLREVSDPRFSPDSGRVSYTVSESSLETDKTPTAVWVVSLQDGEEIRMTRRGTSASHARWSPDGKYLSFQAAEHDAESRSDQTVSRAQVWLLDRRGGEAQKLTDIPQGLLEHEWSPDGKRLVLVIRDREAEGTEEEGKRTRPWVIDRLQFKRDRMGYLDRRRTHLYLFDLATRKLEQLTFGDFDDSEPVWSPDGKSVAFVSNRTPEPDSNSNTDIWIAAATNDPESSARDLRRVTSNAGPDTQPAWSPDGQSLAYVAISRPELIWYAGSALGLADLNTGGTRLLTASLDRNVGKPVFDPDGHTIHFLLEDGGVKHLATVDTLDGSVARSVGGERKIEDFSMSPAGRLVFLSSEPDFPNEVFLLENLPRRLTFQNRDLLSQHTLAATERIRVKSRDGTVIESFVVKPPGFEEGNRYPTILWLHGGPVYQYFFDFNEVAQFFASHGYLVVLPNPRGSSGYGQDFSMGIWQAWGEKDVEDVLAALDEVIRRGWGDGDRTGVGGWSYGGILTNYVITQTGRFKAATTGASEVLYAANYGHDHYQLQWEKELGLPWENRELWERLSPFNKVENIVTPTLIMGGEKDWNVPILNSEQLYQALKRLGRTTQLVVYPGESHRIRKPRFVKDRYERWIAWFDHYLQEAAPASAPGRSGSRF